MSGLSRTPGKRVWVYPHRGFESRPLRQSMIGPSGARFALRAERALHAAQLQLIPAKAQFVACASLLSATC
jgi:hypothetical protein